METIPFASRKHSISKSFWAISLLFAALLGYLLYYYQQQRSIYIIRENMQKHLNQNTIHTLQNIALLDSANKLRYKKSAGSPENFLRIQAITCSYNNSVAQKNRKKYGTIFMSIDRYLWTYVSYVNIDLDGVTNLYLNCLLYPDRYKIYDYSKVLFHKNINDIDDKQLKELYEIGK